MAYLAAYAVTMNRFDPALLRRVRNLIESGDLAGAIRVHRFFYPPAGDSYIHETDEGDLLECLTTPLPVFSFCSEEELNELRIRMALALVEGRNFKLAPDASLPWRHRMRPEAAVHNFFASVACYRNVVQWKRSGVVLRAKILNSGDGGCPACQAIAEQDYELSDLPSIPFHGCENLEAVGCRCIVVASQIRGINA